MYRWLVRRWVFALHELERERERGGARGRERERETVDRSKACDRVQHKR
jgi:hypothetical protein